MYTTLDFLVRLNARRFIVGASPELKFRTIDEADTAHVVSELPTASKPWYIFSPEFVQTATFLASNASVRHCLFWIICHRQFYYSCLSPCFVERCWQGKKSVSLINVDINFGYEYFRFVIHFSKSFFCQNFFPTFFPKIFFSKLFSQICFFNIFF